MRNTGASRKALLAGLLLAWGGLFAPVEGFSWEYPSLQDTVPPPPPPGPEGPLISGPGIACVGETSFYSLEAAVGCSVIWTINGVVWPVEGVVLEVTWPAEGIQTILAYLSCGPGQPLQLMKEVIVNDQPSPIQIWGDTLVCEFTIHTYHTNAGPFDTCIWTVNGEIQPTISPALVYAFEGSGEYVFNVEVRNNCGTGAPDPLTVNAAGSAPPPPGPVEGPDTCCTLTEVTYTTTVPPGYPCIWLVDGVLQPDTADYLDVTWTTTGPHLVEARTVGDCGTSSPSYLFITVFTLPVVDLGPDTAIYEGEFIILDAGNPGCSYLWSTGDTTRTIVVDSAGIYSVTVSGYCGSDWDDIEVSILVGMMEDGPDLPFTIRVSDRKIIISSWVEHGRLEVYSISGLKIYGGPLTDVITVPSPGIYLVRIFSLQQSCARKVLVP